MKWSQVSTLWYGRRQRCNSKAFLWLTNCPGQFTIEPLFGVIPKQGASPIWHKGARSKPWNRYRSKEQGEKLERGMKHRKIERSRKQGENGARDKELKRATSKETLWKQQGAWTPANRGSICFTMTGRWLLSLSQIASSSRLHNCLSNLNFWNTLVVPKLVVYSSYCR